MIIPKNLKEPLKKAPLIIGVGPSAWPRMLAKFYFPKFKTISYYDCQDNDLIRKDGVEVFSIKEQNPDFELSPVTPGNILDSDYVKKYLASQKEPFVLLIYKAFGKLEKVCSENGWQFIGNSKELIDKYEDKRVFKETIRGLNIKSIPGDNLPIESLTEEVFKSYQKQFGTQKIVLQLAEVTYGGGSGTLYINSSKDLTIFRDRVAQIKKNLEGKKKKIETVNIAPFIEGTSCSIACCATKFGTLTGTIQNQIVDIKDVGALLPKRSGTFAGHDWAYRHYSSETNKKAQEIGQKFGSYLYKQGYKGIFGLDLIVDEGGEVWPVECNPRETDAFPLICMLQMESGAVPMAVFHILEHINSDYKINFEEVDAGLKGTYNAAQILLYNKLDTNGVDRALLQAGVYKVENKKLMFQKPGYLLSDIKDESEFLLTEAISKSIGYPYKPHERMIRFIKRGGILESENKLKTNVLSEINLIYKHLKIVPVKEGLVRENNLNVLYKNRLLEALKSDLTGVEVLNTIYPYKTGLRRPLKVSWRKDLDKNTTALKQIRSKDSQKQIKYDIQKIKELNIEIKIIENLDNNTFLEWLDLYKKIILDKSGGHPVIGADWLNQKIKEGKKISAALAFQDNKIIGGDIFFEVSGRLSVGYGVAKRLQGLRGGLGLVLDYKFVEYALSKGYSQVSFGQDTNFYGIDLSTGLALYKLKLGFYPVPANKTYWLTTYFLDYRKITGPVLMFTGNTQKITKMVVLNPKNEANSLKVNEKLLNGLELVNLLQTPYGV